MLLACGALHTCGAVAELALFVLEAGLGLVGIIGRLASVVVDEWSLLGI